MNRPATYYLAEARKHLGSGAVDSQVQTLLLALLMKLCDTYPHDYDNCDDWNCSICFGS